MKKLLLLFFISSLAFNADAQRRKKDKWPPLPLILFDNKEEYDFDKGEKVGEFRGYDWTVGKLALLTYVDKKNVKRHPAMKLWGCKVGDQNYRIVNGRAYRILDKGNGIYYENGFAHMNMLMDDEGYSDVDLGSYSFLSKDLNSEILEIPSKKAAKHFEDDASLAPFLECIRKRKPHHTEKIRECMKANN